jgi:hypothetical protein
MASTKNSDADVTVGDRTWITGKPRRHQKMMIMAFRELIFFLGLFGLSAPGGSHYCSESIVSQNHDSSSTISIVSDFNSVY